MREKPEPKSSELALVPPIVPKKKQSQARVEVAAEKASSCRTQKCVDENTEEEVSGSGLISLFGSKAL